jgi:hypothetical protein
MTDQQEGSSAAIDQAIEELQRAAEATRVPGELRDWLEPMQAALARVRRVLSGELLPRHRHDFHQIAKEFSLVPKVEQLKQEDADLLATTLQAEALAAKAAVILDRSGDQEEDVESLTELGTLAHSLVLRLRAQEQAIDTWFVEALNRDEGEGD